MPELPKQEMSEQRPVEEIAREIVNLAYLGQPLASPLNNWTGLREDQSKNLYEAVLSALQAERSRSSSEIAKLKEDLNSERRFMEALNASIDAAMRESGEKK